MVKNMSFCYVLDNPPVLPQSFHLSPSSRHSNPQSRPLSLQSSLELRLIWVSRFVGWLRIYKSENLKTYIPIGAKKMSPFKFSMILSSVVSF